MGLPVGIVAVWPEIDVSVSLCVCVLCVCVFRKVLLFVSLFACVCACLRWCVSCLLLWILLDPAQKWETRRPRTTAQAPVPPVSADPDVGDLAPLQDLLVCVSAWVDGWVGVS